MHTLFTRPGTFIETGKSKHQSRDNVFFTNPVETVQLYYVLSPSLDQSLLTYKVALVGTTYEPTIHTCRFFKTNNADKRFVLLLLLLD